MTTHYLLSCSISATVRQSVQIDFKDLKLPDSVITTLQRNNTVSLRPNLSNALKKELDALRVLQRELYDGYCIHFGDSHFVTSKYFHTARELIRGIKLVAQEANQRLRNTWAEEYEAWQETTRGILRPLFTDDQEYADASAAYELLFPNRKEYENPIHVAVVGPLPVSLEAVSEPTDDSPLEELAAYENSINTAAVLEAAKAQAADKALSIGAELIDDLDCRYINKIGKQQTGSDKRRGSWEITAEKLKLIADSVPGFDRLAELSTELLQAGKDLQDGSKEEVKAAAVTFQRVNEEIRDELENICNSRDSSRGLEKLKKSISLSSKYKTLCERIARAENANELNLMIPDVELELDIYEQRSRQLKRLLVQRKELIYAAKGDNLDNLITEIQSVNDTQPDF